MSSQFERLLKIELNISSSHPELLEGLDNWLRLGLLSDSQVKQLCRTYLSSPLPPPIVAATPAPAPRISPDLPDFITDFVTESSPSRSRPSPNARVGILQSLMAELSVRWLLFLGVFLVVVSSGVLAASQWQRFPAAAQYGVLFAYTVIFWGVSFWASKKPNLQLTAQTLEIVTLLLTPVNFWAMDSFNLWQYPLGWLTVAIATISLTFITTKILKNHLPPSPLRIAELSVLPLVNILGLSYLQWGWKISGFPIIAVYLGMVGTSLLTFYQTRYQLSQINAQDEEENNLPKLGINLASGVLIYALVVLLLRAIFIIQLDVRQLGLAIGICGWLLAWLSQQKTSLNNSTSSPEFPWEIIGGCLLFLGWIVSVGTELPWQALAVSGLGLWFFFSRLQRLWLKPDLTAISLIGLQAIWLAWRLVPQSIKQIAIANVTQITGSQNLSWVALGVVLFPYLFLMLGLIEWLYRSEKAELAYFGEQLTLSLGILLNFISLANPTVRSLNLLLSTVTLAIVTQRRSPTRITLVYLTHITGLLAVFSIVNRLYPTLDFRTWASILLSIMLAEWGFSLTNMSPIWRRSAWHIGLGLAALSYQLLLPDINSVQNQNWGIIWLITPLALTGVASRTAIPQRTNSTYCSIGSLLIAQYLTINLPGTRLIGLGVATALMLLNSWYIPQLGVAAITVGFGLSFIAVLLQDLFPQISIADWFLVGAIAISILWITQRWLIQHQSNIVQIYAQATDAWATIICAVELFSLTFHSFSIYQQFERPNFLYLIAAAIVAAIVLYRSWGKPTPNLLYAFYWAIELCLAEGIRLYGGDAVNLAVANISVALITVVIGDLWRIKQLNSNSESIDEQSIIYNVQSQASLLYILLGIIFRIGYFNNWTGLISLGAALTGILLARRTSGLKLLAYLSLIGITLGWYELVIYQMLQSPGGSIADGWTILAAVATAIALIYRIFAFLLERFLPLSLAEIKATAHIHWGIGSILMLFAANGAIPAGIASRIGTNPQLTNIGIIVSLILAAYAIVQGRNSINQYSSWVYIGLIEVVGIWIYARLIWTQLSVLDPWIAAISCIIAFLLYIFPWTDWGWPETPWKNSSAILPILAVILTSTIIPSTTLVIVGGFYLWLAFRSDNIRFTYISLALANWVLFRWFGDLKLIDGLWYTTPIGLSLLYIAQCDRGLKLPENKGTRHNLRCLGISLICLVALFFHQETGIQPGILGILAIFAGLSLRVRAFLYIGTFTFISTVFYQSIFLILKYPFSKWIILLLLGVGFISLAANFETRRQQLSTLLRNWVSELQTWE